MNKKKLGIKSLKEYKQYHSSSNIERSPFVLKNKMRVVIYYIALEIENRRII